MLPLDLAIEGDPAVANGDLDLVVRHRGVVLEGPDGGLRDVGVGPITQARKFDLDLVDDGLDAVDALGRLHSLVLLSVGRDGAAQRNHAVLRRHADVCRVDPRLPLELFHDVAL